MASVSVGEFVLAARPPLAHRAVDGRHGPAEGEPGVVLAVRTGLRLTMLIVRKGRYAETRRLAAAEGVQLPGPGRSAVIEGVRILWAGPDQWLVVAEPHGGTAADGLVASCATSCMAVEQSDARAVIAVSGRRAREILAKSVPIDLHPRLFAPGATALTGAAGVMVQIWQTDEAPTYLVAVPLSFSEDFWSGLIHAAAEFGVQTFAAV